jgi:hypothetical protein
MARWSPEVASLMLMSHTLAREKTGVGPHLGFQGIVGVRNWCEQAGGDCESNETPFHWCHAPDHRTVSGGLGALGLHGVAQIAIKKPAITSKLTMIVASAALSMMESRRSMRECFRNSTDGVDLGQEVPRLGPVARSG